MRKWCSILLIASSFTCGAQGFTRCTVFQFEGFDSSHASIALQQSFGPDGHLLSEIYSGYKSSANMGTGNAHYMYVYKAGLLAERTYSYKEGDSSKTTFYYDDRNRLIKEDHFSFERRLKKGVDKGLGRPGGCLLADSDFEKHRTWQYESGRRYAYDVMGRKAKEDDLNGYTRTWHYDSLGMVLAVNHYAYKKLARRLEYVYRRDGYDILFSDYDDSGKSRQETEPGNWPRSMRTFIVNEKGTIIEELYRYENGEVITRKKYAYYQDGKLYRTVHYNEWRQPEITHIYVYE